MALNRARVTTALETFTRLSRAASDKTRVRVTIADGLISGAAQTYCFDGDSVHTANAKARPHGDSLGTLDEFAANLEKQIAHIEQQQRDATELLELFATLRRNDGSATARSKRTVNRTEALWLLDIDDGGKLIIKRKEGTVHALRSYGSPGKQVFASIEAALIDYHAKVKSLTTTGSHEPEQSTSGWRIEQARSARSTCRVCGKNIAEGEYRFGHDDQLARWFHLECAAKGAPRAFVPFAERAAQFQAKTPKKEVAKPKGTAAPTAIKNALLAKPNDRDAMSVYADFLQSSGDPWGELIALELAKKPKEAQALFKQHADDLSGGFGLRLLKWKYGFVRSADFASNDPAQVEKMITHLGATRTLMLLHALALEVRPTSSLFTTLATHAPSTLRTLTVFGGAGLEALSLPNLSRLTVRLRTPRPDVKGLLDAKLPGLRTLEFQGKTSAVLTIEFLDALLDSKLFSKLKVLRLWEGALDEAAAEFVITNQKRFAKLAGLELSLGFPRSEKVRGVFAKQFDFGSRQYDRESNVIDTWRVYR